MPQDTADGTGCREKEKLFKGFTEIQPDRKYSAARGVGDSLTRSRVTPSGVFQADPVRPKISTTCRIGTQRNRVDRPRAFV